MNGHRFDPSVYFCEQCGVGMDENMDFNVPCYPSAAGMAFTMRRREDSDRLVKRYLDEIERTCEAMDLLDEAMGVVK
ncbi:hypothetical protein LCGC14_0355340 [marine sediment metagenome]|uniref:Uncharacterized protein n=1 Tax=marine sediment metagenome TaxID=412755 RepID=A0A0F9TFC2_9ZZZZ